MFTQTTNAQAINSMSITMVSPHIDTFEFGLQITIGLAHSLKAKWMYFNKLPAIIYIKVTKYHKIIILLGVDHNKIAIELA